jgi:CheY-like chemotaxis protein
VDLVTVINTAIDAMRPAAGAKEIRLELNLDPDTAPIAGDSDRLQQVVWNLVSNAIKFTPKRGLVEIRLQQLNSHIEIVVNDSGCGISAEMLPHIFDRFWQADSTSTRQYGGLGLGLALVKHITELHGGTIRAESGGVNKGALFIVNLPLMAQVTPEVPGRQSANSADVLSTVGSSSIKGLRLLVADDDAETVELFTRLLTQQGAEVINAKSAAETLERLRSTLPDVLICDIEMPDEDGYSLIRKVRLLGAKEGGGVPAVAVTAYGSTDDRIRLLAAGFQMHVPKPVDPAELVTVVASVAGRIRT